ncbi:MULTISPECIES: hypothetical protein [unclassified Vibrio]|uniref:hypothetical protein n=1 Tax=unclassified Vibrio TaxID=2614977 RepID=UPI000C847E36|nr:MULTISPECIES: hypothetical protein [unclassified Vibrio]PMK74286.1 hypothetical protein BCT92_07185 [Vibrio sp. 10N.261.52.E5]TKF84819.1 hypothetical protein FCV65_04640 [Vibrio sp. F13]
MSIVNIDDLQCPPSNALLFQWWVNDVRPSPDYQDKIDLTGKVSLEGYTLYYQKKENGCLAFEVPILRFVYHCDESRWVVSSYDVMGSWVKISAAKTLSSLFTRLPVKKALEQLNLSLKPIKHIEATLWTGKNTFISGYVETPFDQGVLWRIYLEKNSKNKYLQITKGDFKKVNINVFYEPVRGRS